MKKSKCNKICPFCNNNNVIKHGFNNDHKQKYRCKSCKRVFTDNPRFTIERGARRALTVLLNLLQNNLYNNNDFYEALNKSSKNNKSYKINNISYNPNGFIYQYGRTASLNCHNPKLLICENDGNISFYAIQHQYSNGYRTIAISI